MRRIQLYAAICALLFASAVHGGVIYQETRGITFSTANGLINVEPSGFTFTPANGITFSTANGITFSTANGMLFGNPSGITFSTADGITFGTAGGITFSTANGITFGTAGDAGELTGLGLSTPDGITFGTANERPALDLELLRELSLPADTSSLNVVVSYHQSPASEDFDALRAVGIAGGTVLRALPMVIVNATREQVQQLQALPNVRSIYSNKNTALFSDPATRAQVFADEALVLAETQGAAGAATGRGIGVAVLDTGIDATHPDLSDGRVKRNMKIASSQGSSVGFTYPAVLDQLANSDEVYGHGTFVAGIIGGSGAQSGGEIRGLAPGAHLIGVSAGELVLTHVLEGLDTILLLASEENIKVVNCSFGVQGLFDPDDPVNIATRAMYDRGITVVMAAGNEGPRPGSISPYAVAPWVVGVSGMSGDRNVASWSSRGYFASMLYAPTISAPAARITSLRATGTVLVGATEAPLSTVSSTYYATASGTSFSTAVISALAARMYELRPTIAPLEVKAILQHTATTLPTYDRSEIGSGKVNFAAALHKTAVPKVEYGSLLKDQFYQSDFDYTVSRNPSITGPAPAELGIAVETLEVVSGTAGLHVALGWGPQPSTRDLDLYLISPDGTTHSSTSRSAAGLFGATEAIELREPMPGTWRIEIRTATAAPESGTYTVASETYVANYRTLTSFTGSDALAMQRLVRARVITSGAPLDGSETIDRYTAARAFVAYGQPRFLPASATFQDAKGAQRIYAESAAGDQTLSLRVFDEAPSFDGNEAMSRIEYVRAVVRFAGLENRAQDQAGASLDLADSNTLSSEDRGYVSVALKAELIDVRENRIDAAAPVTSLTLGRSLYNLR